MAARLRTGVELHDHPQFVMHQTEGLRGGHVIQPAAGVFGTVIDKKTIAAISDK